MLGQPKYSILSAKHNVTYSYFSDIIEILLVPYACNISFEACKKDKLVLYFAFSERGGERPVNYS